MASVFPLGVAVSHVGLEVTTQPWLVPFFVVVTVTLAEVAVEERPADDVDTVNT